nr:hypothetical protein [Pedobacter sp. ASV19]
MTFTTYRDNCNGGGSSCSNDPNTTEIKLINGTNSWSLNGANKKNTTTVLELLPGTYTVNVTVREIQEYGRVSFSAPVVVGYNYKIAAGGLRIKKLTNYDPVTNQYNIRKYEYLTKGDQDRSSGTILSLPNYIYTTQRGQTCSPGTGNPLPNCMGWQTFVTVTSQSNSELFFSEGSPVSYTRVVEKLGENGEGGSIEYLFSFVGDQITRGFPFPVPSSRGWGRGLPEKTTYLTASGDTTYKEINEYYFEPTLNRNQIKGYKTGLYKYCPAMANMIQINIGQMDYTSEWFYLKKNTKITYNPSGQVPVSDITEFFYDNPQHIQITRKKHTLSNGSFDIIHYKYPMDYNISSSSVDPSTSALLKMQTKNMLDYVVEQTECVESAGQEFVKKSGLNLFKEFLDNQIYISKQFQFASESPVQYSPLTNVLNGEFSFNAGYSKYFEATIYNQMGQLVQFDNIAGMTKSFIYHSNGILPIAAVTNASANEIYFNGFEEVDGPQITSTPKYGLKSYSGIYTISGNTIKQGSYIKSWWEKEGTKWTYYTVPFVHNGSNNISFGLGSLIDNVSIYPTNSELESFDYDMTKGLISRVKANGSGVQYRYDSLLRLSAVLDQNGNIIKSNIYHYKP